MSAAQDLVTAYLEWLKDNMSVREVEGWVEISTPFLDRHNDYLQIYVRADGDQLTLTDDSYVIQDLLGSGCDVSTPRRRELLERIVHAFGIQVENDELTVRATKANFAQRKHSLLQAMLSVNDLFLTSRSTVRTLFLEEVEQFLMEHQIRFISSVQVAGRTGLTHAIDYVIPSWDKAPERLIKTINNPTKEKVTSMLFAWNDIRDFRKSSRLYAMVNDTDKPLSANLASVCQDQGVNVVPWSRRQEYLAELSA